MIPRVEKYHFKPIIYQVIRSSKLNLFFIVIIEIIGLSENTWVLGNIKHAGFYRVNYDMTNWNLLIKQLHDDHTLIDETSRSALIDDSFNLGKADQIDQTVFLDIVSYLSTETSNVPFTASLDGLSYIGQMIADNYTLAVSFKVSIFKMNLINVNGIQYKF